MPAPLTNVTRKENEVIRYNQDLSLDRVILAGFKLPFKPGYGTAGIAIVLRINYFETRINPNKNLYNYRVEMRLFENPGWKGSGKGLQGQAL